MLLALVGLRVQPLAWLDTVLESLPFVGVVEPGTVCDLRSDLECARFLKRRKRKKASASAAMMPVATTAPITAYSMVALLDGLDEGAASGEGKVGAGG